MIPSQMMKVQCGPEIIGKDKIVNPWNSLQTTYKVLRNETFLLREASHDDKHCPNLIPRLWIFVPRCKLTGNLSSGVPTCKEPMVHTRSTASSKLLKYHLNQSHKVLEKSIAIIQRNVVQIAKHGIGRRNFLLLHKASNRRRNSR